MKSWLRHHGYALRVALRRLVQQPFSSLANILVIALSLTLPLAGTIVLSGVQPVLGHLTVNASVTLFFAHDVDSASVNHTAQRLQTEHADVIAAVRIVPRAQALAQFSHHPGWSEALAVLQDNPLPDAIVVTLYPDATTQIEALAQTWRQWQTVDRVQLDSDWVRRLQALLEALRIGLGLLGACVGLVVLATTSNTVRMQALGQREEIAVARLVGATESFVRRPFLYLGALSGIAAGLLAITITAAALSPVNAALHTLAASYSSQFTLILPNASTLLMVLLGVVVLCALAARWSVTRATRT